MNRGLKRTRVSVNDPPSPPKKCAALNAVSRQIAVKTRKSSVKVPEALPVNYVCLARAPHEEVRSPILLSQLAVIKTDALAPLIDPRNPAPNTVGAPLPNCRPSLRPTTCAIPRTGQGH